MTIRTLLLAGLVAITSGCGMFSGGEPPAPPQVQSTAEQLKALAERAGAPLFDGMGQHTHPITTSVPAAQRYFDQGLVLAFGFNHAESVRAFRAAQTLDARCAMCFWGEALATGPNINVTSNGKATMSDEARMDAFEALQKAISLKGRVSQAEQDYIDALSARYNGDPGTPRGPLDIAYANAMGELADKYPEDDDAAALYAEALMNTMPWDYWADDGQPKTQTREVIGQLEQVIERNPQHPLALHLYIHAVEASSNPGRAEAAADELADLVPGSGHLVHMPAHIYWRIGRYHDASEANIRAARVDEEYIAQCNAQGFYPAAYYPHNIHFLWAASSMEGRSALAIESAEKVAANVRLEQIEQFPTIEFFKTIPLLSLTQFGQWPEIIAQPTPPAHMEYWTAIWHYARGVAFSRLGNFVAAQAEQQALAPMLTTDTIYQLDQNDYPASALLGIANQLLLGEIALGQDRMSAAIDHFATAVSAQDRLPYTEPPFWYYPTRQSLGLAYLRADLASEAEEVYRRDLQDYPRNGWSMFGLAQSLEAQQRLDDAQAVRERFETVWQFADVELEASRF